MSQTRRKKRGGEVNSCLHRKIPRPTGVQSPSLPCQGAPGMPWEISFWKQNARYSPATNHKKKRTKTRREPSRPILNIATNSWTARPQQPYQIVWCQIQECFHKSSTRRGKRYERRTSCTNRHFQDLRRKAARWIPIRVDLYQCTKQHRSAQWAKLDMHKFKKMMLTFDGIHQILAQQRNNCNTVHHIHCTRPKIYVIQWRGGQKEEKHAWMSTAPYRQLPIRPHSWFPKRKTDQSKETSAQWIKKSVQCQAKIEELQYLPPTKTRTRCRQQPSFFLLSKLAGHNKKCERATL